MSLVVNRPYQISTFLGSVTALSGIKGIIQAYSVANDNSSYIAYTSGIPLNSLTHLLPFSGYLFNSNNSFLPIQIYSNDNYFRPNKLDINGPLAFVSYYGNSPLTISSSTLSSKIIAAYSVTSDGSSYVSYISGFPFNSLTTLQPNSGYIIFSTGYPYELYNNPLTPTPTPTPTITPSPYYNNFTFLKIEPFSPSNLLLNLFHSGPIGEPCGFIKAAFSLNNENFTFFTLDNCNSPSHAAADYPGNWYIKLLKFDSYGDLIAESNILYYNTQTGQYGPAPTPATPTPSPTPTNTPSSVTPTPTPTISLTPNTPTPTPTPTTTYSPIIYNLIGSEYFSLAGLGTVSNPGFGESTNNSLDNTTAWFEVRFNIDCTLTFSVTVDSEQDYDFGTILLNGDIIYNKSGQDSTAFLNIPISANDILRMQYSKDEAVSEGTDRLQFYDFYTTIS